MFNFNKVFCGIGVSAIVFFAIAASSFPLLHTGYQGECLRSMQVGTATSATTIAKNSFVTITSGYILPATAGADAVYGVAVSGCDIPSASGGASVLVDSNLDHVFYFVADATADVTADDVGTLIDIASDVLLDGNASTDDVFEVVGVDVPESILDTQAGYYVRLNPEERGLF